MERITNVNLRASLANKDVIIAAGLNVVVFVNQGKQRKKIYVAGTIQDFQMKNFLINFLYVSVYLKQTSRKTV